MKSKAELITDVIRSQLLDKKQVDFCSGLLIETLTSHIKIGSGEYTFTFLCKLGEIVWCAYASREGYESTAYYRSNEDGNEDPIEYLTSKEVKQLEIVIKKAGLKTKITVKRYYIVCVDGDPATRFLDAGRMSGLEFPKGLHSNKFQSEKEANFVAWQLRKYHEELIKKRNLRSAKKKVAKRQ